MPDLYLSLFIQMNYKKLSCVSFPTKRNIKINMMPYVIGKKDTIPPEYSHYNEIIEECEYYVTKILLIEEVDYILKNILMANGEVRGAIK